MVGKWAEDIYTLALVLGLLNTEAATGDVSDAKEVMGYVKQIVINSETLIEHENHSAKIFPESTANICVITAHANANTWSAWGEVADNQGTPDTLTSKFASALGHITGAMVEDGSHGDALYMFEISYGSSNIVVASGRVLTQTNKIPTYQISRMRGAIIPAGETIYARVMCATAGSKTLNVSFRYFLHT